MTRKHRHFAERVELLSTAPKTKRERQILSKAWREQTQSDAATPMERQRVVNVCLATVTALQALREGTATAAHLAELRTGCNVARLLASDHGIGQEAEHIAKAGQAAIISLANRWDRGGRARAIATGQELHDLTDAIDLLHTQLDLEPSKLQITQVMRQIDKAHHTATSSAPEEMHP